MNWKETTVLITGGSKGLGKATAQLLKEAGAKVAITARTASTLEKTAKELGVKAIQGDVSQREEVERIYQEFLNAFGRIDVLVNNAGFGARSSIDDLDMDAFRRVYDTNVFGAAMMGEQAAQAMIKQGSGNIINIASTAALKGYPTGTIYSSSKFALRGMTQCWQQELRRHNIRVILVNPSEVPTAFGTEDGVEKAEDPKKLSPMEIAHTIKSALDMDPRGYIPEVTVHATNPF